MIVAIIPAYNEATRIASVVAGVMHHVDRVIVVDDGSDDATLEVAKKAGAFVLRHMSNGGAGAATMTGIDAARLMGARIAITIDAGEQQDAPGLRGESVASRMESAEQLDPPVIPRLFAPLLEDRADIVFANRFGQRNKIPAIRRVFNAIGNIVSFLATGLWVKDSQCGFKAFGPRALADINLRMSGFEFCTEIVREAAHHRWRIAEVPTKVMYSEYTLAKGQSFASGVRTAFKILLRSFLR